MRIEGDREAARPGHRGVLRVRINGRRLTPGRSLKVWNHSPTGFECGYGGSGPAQLALAILLHAGVPKDRAVALHQTFKWAFVADLQTPFCLELDVLQWASEQPE